MKRSMIFATLVLCFGVALGCSESKKSGQAPPPPSDGGGGGSGSCAADQVWDEASGSCLASSPDNFQLFNNLNITRSKVWASFLDDYFFMASPYAQICSVGFYDNILFWYFPFGSKDCETYTRDRRITLNLSSLLIAENGSTVANLQITARSSWNSLTNVLHLPISTPSVSVNRIAVDDNPNSGFMLQMTIAGRNGPKIFRIKGNSIDMVSSNGADIELYYGNPGSLKKFGTASLYID